MASLINVNNSLEGNQVSTFTVSLPVYQGAVSSIKAGMLVVRNGSHAGFVSAAADGTDNTAEVLGVAVSDSTETVSVAGTVTIEAGKSLIVKMKAKTPASLTQALCLTDRYCLTVSSGSYKLDEATTTNGFMTLISFDNTTDGNCLVSIPCNGW